MGRRGSKVLIERPVGELLIFQRYLDFSSSFLETLAKKLFFALHVKS